MTIDNKTAQLILDAIAWCNYDWHKITDTELETVEEIDEARMDFVRFCHDRGIDEVTKVVRL